MDLLQAVMNAGGGSAVDQLAQKFGLSTDQTQSVLGQLVPALAGGMAHNASQEGGLDNLVNAVTNGSHANYVDNPASLAHPDAVEDGNSILGHLFGSKDVSRQVATQAASSTGVSADIIKQMLPMVATLAMGAMAKHVINSQTAAAGAGAGASDGGLGGMLGGALSSLTGGGGGLGSVLGSMMGSGGAASSGSLGGLLGGLTSALGSSQTAQTPAGGSIIGMLAPMLAGGAESGMAGNVIGMLGKMMGR